jgi:hypothetical protein
VNKKGDCKNRRIKTGEKKESNKGGKEINKEGRL